MKYNRYKSIAGFFDAFETFLLASQKNKPLSLLYMQGQEFFTPAVPPGLTNKSSSLAYLHTPAFLITGSHPRRPYSGNLFLQSPFQFALTSPFTLHPGTALTPAAAL